MTPSQTRALARVTRVVREMMDYRGVGYDELEQQGMARSTLTRCLKTGNVRLTTLATVADFLDCDVIVHLRVRPRSTAQNVRSKEVV